MFKGYRCYSTGKLDPVLPELDAFDGLMQKHCEQLRLPIFFGPETFRRKFTDGGYCQNDLPDISIMTRLRVPAFSGHYTDISPEAEEQAVLADFAAEVASEDSSNPLPLDVDFLEGASDSYSESTISSMEEDEVLNLQAVEESHSQVCVSRRQSSAINTINTNKRTAEDDLFVEADLPKRQKHEDSATRYDEAYAVTFFSKKHGKDSTPL